ncbi:hypothetical protein [Burkholderia semiarida]|uniref:hypothetical protein n=1 Tax=Burkholderia semiarida TaxID=2843303 RepID=UPI0038779E7E
MALIATDFSGLKAAISATAWAVHGDCLVEPFAAGILDPLKNTLLNQVIFPIRAVICL